ncbi:Uncharacterized protein TCM_023538 [Theobroma cacao]|uniref:Uncharacterized protein n=1 Tax=Theobroma cacao TaxID=3641 RepID=A0A061EWA2_THECC|nr:Uncharacterized protein TCM_023538 [Theobroma cacao]
MVIIYSELMGTSSKACLGFGGFKRKFRMLVTAEERLLQQGPNRHSPPGPSKPFYENWFIRPPVLSLPLRFLIHCFQK